MIMKNLLWCCMTTGTQWDSVYYRKHRSHFLFCDIFIVATVSSLYSVFYIRDVWGTLFSLILFGLISRKSFAMAPAFRLLLSVCIEWKSVGFRTSFLWHQVLAVSPTTDIVRYMLSRTSLQVPKLRASVVACGQKIIRMLCTLIKSVHRYLSSHP